MDKKNVRKSALKDRLNNYDINKSRIIVDEIIKSNILDKYNHIAIYYPIGTEINIIDLVKYYSNKKFYLPITKDEINFVYYDTNTKLIDGPFNTKEPIGDIVNRDLIECFVIPCVAINKDNKRIGYGKGYYDRYLNGYKGYKIGVCYKEYGNVDLKLENHDVILDYKFLG